MPPKPITIPPLNPKSSSTTVHRGRNDGTAAANTITTNGQAPERTQNQGPDQDIYPPSAPYHQTLAVLDNIPLPSPSVPLPTPLPPHSPPLIPAPYPTGVIPLSKLTPHTAAVLKHQISSYYSVPSPGENMQQLEPTRYFRIIHAFRAQEIERSKPPNAARGEVSLPASPEWSELGSPEFTREKAWQVMLPETPGAVEEGEWLSPKTPKSPHSVHVGSSGGGDSDEVDSKPRSFRARMDSIATTEGRVEGDYGRRGPLHGEPSPTIRSLSPPASLYSYISPTIVSPRIIGPTEPESSTSPPDDSVSVYPVVDSDSVSRNDSHDQRKSDSTSRSNDAYAVVFPDTSHGLLFLRRLGGGDQGTIQLVQSLPEHEVLVRKHFHRHQPGGDSDRNSYLPPEVRLSTLKGTLPTRATLKSLGCEGWGFTELRGWRDWRGEARAATGSDEHVVGDASLWFSFVNGGNIDDVEEWCWNWEGGVEDAGIVVDEVHEGENRTQSVVAVQDSQHKADREEKTYSDIGEQRVKKRKFKREYPSNERPLPDAFIWWLIKGLGSIIGHMHIGYLGEGRPLPENWRPIIHRDPDSCNILLNYDDTDEDVLMNGEREGRRKYPNIIVADFGYAGYTTDKPSQGYLLGPKDLRSPEPWEDIWMFFTRIIDFVGLGRVKEFQGYKNLTKQEIESGLRFPEERVVSKPLADILAIARWWLSNNKWRRKQREPPEGWKDEPCVDAKQIVEDLLPLAETMLQLQEERGECKSIRGSKPKFSLATLGIDLWDEKMMHERGIGLLRPWRVVRAKPRIVYDVTELWRQPSRALASYELWNNSKKIKDEKSYKHTVDGKVPEAAKGTESQQAKAERYG